ncbi:MAG TPA: NAD(P)H-binding protein [Haliangiales bacterium]|nr:NAD(P)H-binding protein [Haliangiales bacterium]
MRIAILGGTGTLGRAAIDTAVAAGHDVVAISRRAPGRLPPGVAHAAADVTTGDGLARALAGAEVLIDATNARRDAGKVLIEGTRRVLEAARDAGARHFVGISIVGIDDAPIAYYRVKAAQEKVIAEGPVPWSLLRATQFHDLVAEFARGTLGVVLAPRGWLLQPVDVREVAAALVAAVGDGPSGRLPDVAGPEVAAFGDLARAWKRAAGRRRLIIPVPVPGAIGRHLRSGRMCNVDRSVGTISFGDWLAERYGGAEGRPATETARA